MEFEYAYVKTITTDSKYCRDWRDNISKAGYTIIDFRPPLRGELYVASAIDPPMILPCDFKCKADNPYLIVKKKEQFGYDDTCVISVRDSYYGKLPRIPKGYKQIAFRPPKLGETYLISDNDAMESTTLKHRFPFIILAKDEK